MKTVHLSRSGTSSAALGPTTAALWLAIVTAFGQSPDQNQSSAFSSGGAVSGAGEYANQGTIGQIGGRLTRGAVYALAGGYLTVQLGGTPEGPAGPLNRFSAEPANATTLASGLTIVPQGGATLPRAVDGSMRLANSSGAGGAGVLVLGDEKILSNQAGRIVQKLQPPLPLVYEHHQTDLEFLRLVGHYADPNAAPADVEFRVGVGVIDQGQGDHPCSMGIVSALGSIGSQIRVDVFDTSKQHVDTLTTASGPLGHLRGAGNIVAAGWVTFPCSVWIVLDQPATLTLPNQSASTGTLFRFHPALNDEVLANFRGLGLSSANSGQGSIGLGQLTARNPSPPRITSARVGPGGALTLELPAEEDVFFRVEERDELGSDGWEPGSVYVFGQGAVEQIQNVIVKPRRFFRVVAE